MSEATENCGHDCEHCASKSAGCPGAQQEAESLKNIKHRIVVLSGKGGVGKSTVAVNLAWALSRAGAKVGLLDVDLHGPSVPVMLGLRGMACSGEDNKIVPLNYGDLKVISVDFFLPREEVAVVWRGPVKDGAIKQLLEDVAWGDLDFLVVDCPPGTGDEPLSVCQRLKDGDTSAIVVTTPQEVSAVDVRRSLDFCRQLKLPVLGVVENMSGFVCPHCGKVTHIFKQGGGRALAEKAHVPFLGEIPIDPAVGEAGDGGFPFMDAPASPATQAFQSIVDLIYAIKG